MAEQQDGANVGPQQAFFIQQVSVHKSNMLGACKMCVKSLVDLAAFETITDDCLHVFNLCNVLEHIFSHRLQARRVLFGQGEPISYWEVIQRHAPSSSLTSVGDMEDVLTDLGRARAWLRLVLVQKKLASYMQTVLSNQPSLAASYLPGAFMLSEELVELAGTLKCLDAIDFNLCIRGADFDFGEVFLIDYSPYLLFKQNRPSVADDSVEERKLRTPQRKTNQPPRSLTDHRPSSQNGGGVANNQEGAESSGSEDVDGGGVVDGAWPGESSPQLREMIKTEREQKNYFEELVSVRDTQLAKSHRELSDISMECDRQQKQMEDIVLELQQEIERLQLELRESQRKQQQRPDSIPEDAAASQNSSPRKRATSLLSSFLGSKD